MLFPPCGAARLRRVASLLSAESVLQQIDLLKITASLLASFISFIVIFLFRTCSAAYVVQQEG